MGVWVLGGVAFLGVGLGACWPVSMGLFFFMQPNVITFIKDRPLKHSTQETPKPTTHMVTPTQQNTQVQSF